MEVESNVPLDRLGIDYLDFRGACITLTDNQIIWAPNGTAKTSVCTALKRQGGDDVMLVNYEDCLQLFKKKSRRSIQIGASIRRITEID